jgi:uncharacterized membrane protein
MSPVHLHLLFNHVPVIGTVIALCLLAFAALRGDDRIGRVSLGLLAVLAAAAVATYLTGEPAEEAVEGVAGIPRALVERHEEAALLATIALGAMGALSAGWLLLFRRRPLSRGVMLGLLLLALAPAGAMAYAANLGGQIRHTEIRAGATTAAGGRAAATAADAERRGDD